MPDSALPEHLRGKRHNDFPWPLKWVPRGWTAFKWGKPRLVSGYVNPWHHAEQDDLVQAFGDGPHPKPITSPGTWQLSRFPGGPWWAWYFAFTTRGGTHFRIGARWDDVDGYVEWPSVAVKRRVGG